MDVVVLGYPNCIASAFLGTSDLLTMTLRMLANPTKPRPLRAVTASPSQRGRLAARLDPWRLLDSKGHRHVLPLSPPVASETGPRLLLYETTGHIHGLKMRRDALEIRQKLLEHGVTLLMDQGYHGTGLQELVQSVGVPKGSFYNYFESKEAFSAEVVRHYIEPFINKLDFHLGKKGTTAEKALKAYFKEQIDETEQKNFKGGCLLGNLIGEIGETDDLCLIALKEAVHRYRDKLKEAISRGQKEGSFRDDLSANQMADVLVNFWQGALLRMKVERSVRPLTQFCDLMLNQYFRA